MREPLGPPGGDPGHALEQLVARQPRRLLVSGRAPGRQGTSQEQPIGDRAANESGNWSSIHRTMVSRSPQTG